ncbi:MAG: replicative DNA helicase [Elusimicrobiota bacterium]
MSNNNLTDIIIPHSLEAEKAVLGSMLIEKDAIEVVMEMLSENDFYTTPHKIIFREILKLYDKNQGDVDILMLSESIKFNPQLEQLGGSVYLTSLIDVVVVASNVEYYAKIVRDKAIFRELIHAGRKIINDATGQIDDVNEIVDSAAQVIFNISEKKEMKGAISVSDLIDPTLDAIEEIHKRKEHIPGVPSGFSDLDSMIGGFKKSNFIIIAGRPGTGKTSLCLNIAENAAIHHKKSILIFSLEMSNDELMTRFICSQARVPSDRVKNAYMTGSDWTRITTAAGEFKSTKVFIDDSSVISVLEMKARARRLFKKEGLDLIIIDYLQLMSGKSGRSEYRQLDIAEISRSLKIMAKDLQIPVIALSQLSREPEKRTGDHAGKPRLADLRESGAIEQDADLVLMLYHPDLYKADGILASSSISDTEIIIAKNRNGKTGSTVLRFFKDYTRFENAAKSSKDSI